MTPNTNNTKQSPWQDQLDRQNFRKKFSFISDYKIFPSHDTYLTEELSDLADVENYVFGVLIPESVNKAIKEDREKTFLEIGKLFPEEGGSAERQQIMRRFYQYFKDKKEE